MVGSPVIWSEAIWTGGIGVPIVSTGGFQSKAWEGAFRQHWHVLMPEHGSNGASSAVTDWQSVLLQHEATSTTTGSVTQQLPLLPNMQQHSGIAIARSNAIMR